MEPIPVAARSKAWVCGRSLAGIAGLNPTEDMTTSCECSVLSGKVLCDWPVPLPEVVSLSVISKPQQ
jgi:hypothetical protein